MGPEARFSAQLSKAVKKYQYKKYLAFRIESSHTMAGIPDWLFLFSRDRYIFFELKAQSGKLTPAQKIVFPIMERLGVPIKILTKTKKGIIMTSVAGEEFDTFSSENEFIENILQEYRDVRTS